MKYDLFFTYMLHSFVQVLHRLEILSLRDVLTVSGDVKVLTLDFSVASIRSMRPASRGIQVIGTRQDLISGSHGTKPIILELLWRKIALVLADCNDHVL